MLLRVRQFPRAVRLFGFLKQMVSRWVWLRSNPVRPFPTEEIREATKNAKHIFVPEFNMAGWMGREIKAILPDNERVVMGPHVGGGMTMPSEVIAEQVKTTLGIAFEPLAQRG